MKHPLIIFVLSILVALFVLPGAAKAQSDYGQRLQGANGWLLPVATVILGSDEEKHLGRGSVNAWDLVAPQGSAIYAMASGTVEYAGCDNAGGYGCWVLLQHANGYSSSYGHMIQGSIRVQRGQSVDANTVLGQVGWTGQTSFGPHTHFEIRKGGQFLRIDQFFNIAQMRQCNLCSVQGNPVAATGVTATATNQQSAQATMTRLDTLTAALRQAGPNVVSTAVVALFGLLCLIWWLGGLYERVAVVALATSSVVVGVAFWLIMPAMPVQANQQSAPTGSAAWEWAYPAIQQQEGWRCTNDGAYTMGGVTQGTFNRWRAKLGQPTGDVCRLLTRAEAKQIYHDLYWLPAGGDKLPAAVALTVVDHYINTGRYKFLLDQCGPDVACISRVRTVDYRSMKNFNIYGTAYLNRVKRIANYIQKGVQQ